LPSLNPDPYESGRQRTLRWGEYLNRNRSHSRKSDRDQAVDSDADLAAESEQPCSVRKDVAKPQS